MVWNIPKYLAGFIPQSFRVPVEGYSERLSICDKCEHRLGSFCGVCSCLIAVKARLKSKDCPAGKWPAQRPDNDVK